MTKPHEAPWLTIETTVTLDDGKAYKLYYLAERGRDILNNAVCKDHCLLNRARLDDAIQELKSMLNVLTDLIGGPSAMVEYLKDHILIQLSKGSCRTGVLVMKPYSAFKYVALQELLNEEKVVHTRNGWWKLGKISKE